MLLSLRVEIVVAAAAAADTANGTAAATLPPRHTETHETRLSDDALSRARMNTADHEDVGVRSSHVTARTTRNAARARTRSTHENRTST